MTTEQQRRLARDMQAALATVLSGLQSLDRQSADDLLVLFETAAKQIARDLQRMAGAGGTIDSLQIAQMLGAVDAALQVMRDQQLVQLDAVIRAAAENGSSLISALGAADVPDIAATLPHAPTVAGEIANAVLHGVAEDGLTLSDRIWRNYRSLREELLPTLQRAVLAGDSARDASRAALRSGLQISDEQLNQIEMARAGALGEQAAQILSSPEARAYANAARVFRTELDRANILAARAGIYATPGVVGTRFLLSPAHPRYDICDMHARVNLYGLGPGVYPKGKSPLPAHPNTLSYEEVVFEWEISDQDRDGRHDLMGWLQQRDDEQLYGILGQSENKVAALRAGLLQPDEITQPWRALRAKYENQLQAA